MLFNALQCTGRPPLHRMIDRAPVSTALKQRNLLSGSPGALPEESGQRVSNRCRYSRWEVRTVYPVRALEPRGRPPFSYSYKRCPKNCFGAGLNCGFHVSV